MPRGSTLSAVASQLKAELADSTAVSAGGVQDNELFYIIRGVQTWLAASYDWPFLNKRVDVSVPAGTNDVTRYQTLPDLNFDRPVKVEALYSDIWSEVAYGIGQEEYNAYSSGDNSIAAVQTDPIRRWDWKPGDATKIELWPLPSTAQVLRFSGQRNLTALLVGSAWSLAATLDLDDLLVVYYAAARKLARLNKKDANLMLAQAQDRLNQLRSGFVKRKEVLDLTGEREPIRRPTVVRL